MKIAFPTQEAKGLDSIVYTHFGSANVFIVVDTDTNEFETVHNNDLDHAHNQCQPMKALGNRVVDAVVVGGIGGGALRKLQMSGAIVYRAHEGSVKENLASINSGVLPQFLANQTCSAHEAGEGCCGH